MFRQEFEVTSSGVSHSSSAARLSQVSIAMAPLSGAERAALEGFFKSRRGTAAHPRRPGMLCAAFAARAREHADAYSHAR